MALQLNKPETNVGVSAPEAYARIVHLSYDCLTNALSVAVNVYFDAAAREAGKAPVDGGVFSGIVGTDMPSLDAELPGVRAAVYAWLKSLPYFAGAVDV